MINNLCIKLKSANRELEKKDEQNFKANNDELDQDRRAAENEKQKVKLAKIQSENTQYEKQLILSNNQVIEAKEQLKSLKDSNIQEM